MIPKFRAWTKIGKRMFFSDDILAIDYENKEIVAQQVCFESGLAVERDIYCCDFDELELMQSTGLFDKNGKEIFEGDVIAIEVDDTETPINARVFQNSKIGVLMFHVFEDNEDVPMVELLEDNSVAFEIIGNIYENPELLEVE
ncbi:hypothetical protein H8S88_04725 [Streptococcus sp. GS001]|uniref:YopX family protein n=1 Tax=Streptococcus sp. GS001 TaxID=2766953 RepID=UPI001F457D1C|nr:YopX family protein [Streptococcus sp. GS001]MCF4964644.1 hypothetical protein [Streptococcus sp. GS001]